MLVNATFEVFLGSFFDITDFIVTVETVCFVMKLYLAVHLVVESPHKYAEE
jgi:hypothetical protein